MLRREVIVGKPRATKAEIAAARGAQAERYAKARAVVATGVCPLCGGKLKRNLSLTGWWQCEQLGAPTFRKDPDKASCTWQGFTE
jgi:hypothetical protein